MFWWLKTKSSLQIYNSTFVCISRKALSNTQFPPLDSKKLGFLHCPWSTRPAGYKHKNMLRINRQADCPRTAAKYWASLPQPFWQRHPDLAPARGMLTTPNKHHSAQRPAATSNVILSSFWKRQCSSLKWDKRFWLYFVPTTETVVNATSQLRTTVGKDIQIYSYHSFRFPLLNVLKEILPPVTNTATHTTTISAAKACNEQGQTLWGQPLTCCAAEIKIQFTLPVLSPS